LTWEDLKLLIWEPLSQKNLQKFTKSKHIAEILKGSKKQWKPKLKKAFDIRALCFKQIQDRSAYTLALNKKEEKQ